MPVQFEITKTSEGLTVNIDDKSLKEVQRSTGLDKKSPAIEKAVDLYLREFRKKKLIQKIMEGQIDYPATNDELEQKSLYDSY